jgi:hypothetical protein
LHLKKKGKKIGRKVKVCPPLEEMYALVSSILVPEYILKDFDIYGAKETAEYWVIEMREKAGKIPSELASYSDVVFDGYCNPESMLSHSFACKPIYLRLYRRRYKRSNEDKHCSNKYEFRLKGLKMVPELGIFLKEEDRVVSC